MRTLRILRALRSRVLREHVFRTIESYQTQLVSECPCCGFKGKFESFGTPVRMAASCPKCESKERHRLFGLALRDRFIDFAGKSVLHFAPEPIIKQMAASDGAEKITGADITPGRADVVLNIERLEMPDASVERIICSHVLEHVDDAKALAEIRRVLVPGGYAVIMIPIVEGWGATYEDPSVVTEADRDRLFGQYDHVRFYGADFRDRVRQAGLSLTEYTAEGPLAPQFGLMRGEKVFKAQRPT